MEDRRVIKTKKNLKATLIEMMGEISFEQISITELCKRAEISRITFYAHYSDKYALADDIFSDMLQIGTDIYRTKQEKENPGNGPEKPVYNYDKRKENRDFLQYRVGIH